MPGWRRYGLGAVPPRGAIVELVQEIYRPLQQRHAEFCHPVKESEILRMLALINGMPQAATWRPFEVQLVRRDEGKKLVEVSSPWVGSSTLIFRKEALGDLEAFLLTHGELLPLSCSEAELVIFNPTRLLEGSEALDVDKTDFWRSSTGRIRMYRKCVFVPDVVAGMDVFKLKGLGVGSGTSSIFLSRAAVERFKAAGITGLDYVKEWEG